MIPQGIEKATWDMVIDWLPPVSIPKATLFIQSQVPEHAELHLLLSMMTPLGWLERVPTYKDQQEKLENKDLSTYGFLGYPLLQSADILIYRADKVPVGEDQVPHIEFSREMARRFNHLYGREPNFRGKVQAAIKKLGSKKGAQLRTLCAHAFSRMATRRRSPGACALMDEIQHLATKTASGSVGHLEGTGKMILVEPGALLTEASKMPGLDGHKMSKSYNNTITLREDEASVTQKIKRMPTDPTACAAPTRAIRRAARCGNCTRSLFRRHDQGMGAGRLPLGPASAASNASSRSSTLASSPTVEGTGADARARPALSRPAGTGPRSIIADGNECARCLARATMTDVRQAMGLTLHPRPMANENELRDLDRPTAEVRLRSDPKEDADQPGAHLRRALEQLPLDLYYSARCAGGDARCLRGAARPAASILIRKANVNILDIPMAPLTGNI